MRRLYLIILFVGCLSTMMAQRTEKVHGTYTYTVGENEKITLAEIKNNCILHARNEAIKEKFNENVVSVTNIMDSNINGQALTQFVEETETNLNAEWIADTQKPVITANYENGQLTFFAEVWGEAREIKQASIDLKWKILNGGKSDSFESNRFNDSDPIYIKFKSPIAGYLAIYILDSVNKEANCWIPYMNDPTGRFRIEAGKEYILFDKASNPNALEYELGTDDKEFDRVVLLFSPNPIIKCSDVAGENGEVNSVPIEDFKKWLKKIRKEDKDMMVDQTKWITIINENANK